CITAGTLTGRQSHGGEAQHSRPPLHPNTFVVAYPSAFRSAWLRLAFTGSYTPIVQYAVVASAVADAQIAEDAWNTVNYKPSVAVPEQTNSDSSTVASAGVTYLIDAQLPALPLVGSGQRLRVR